jgi:hypothetical protein
MEGMLMSAVIVNLIIQIIAGAIGGNAAGAAMKNMSLGATGNTIAGAIGGIGGGWILQMLVPAMQQAAATGNFDVGSIIGQIVGGGVGGAVLTAIVGAIKNATARA